MANLRILINEFIKIYLHEGTIKIPEFDDLNDEKKMLSIFQKSIREVYDDLMRIFDMFAERRGGIEGMKPSYDLMVSPRAFDIKNYDGDVVSVNFSCYKASPEDKLKNAIAYFKPPNTISFNLEELHKRSFEEFKQTVVHELAHLKDPYLQRSNWTKKHRDDDKFDDIAIRQEEYTAQMSAYMNLFTSWIKKDPEIFDFVRELIKDLFLVINDDKIPDDKKKLETILDEEKFSEALGEFNYFTWLRRFFSWVKLWVTHPKLKKKFLKDFYKTFEHLLTRAHRRPPLPDRKIKFRK